MFSAGEWWKTTICLIRKKAKKLCTCSTLFLYISLPLFCTTTTWSFMWRMSYMFSFYIFFSLPLIFSLHWCPRAFLSFSPLDLCRHVFRWVSLVCRLLSLFLCLSLAPFSKFVNMTNWSKLNNLDNTDTETRQPLFKKANIFLCKQSLEVNKQCPNVAARN